MDPFHDQFKQPFCQCICDEVACVRVNRPNNCSSTMMLLSKKFFCIISRILPMFRTAPFLISIYKLIQKELLLFTKLFFFNSSSASASNTIHIIRLLLLALLRSPHRIAPRRTRPMITVSRVCGRRALRIYGTYQARHRHPTHGPARR